MLSSAANGQTTLPGKSYFGSRVATSDEKRPGAPGLDSETWETTNSIGPHKPNPGFAHPGASLLQRINLRWRILDSEGGSGEPEICCTWNLNVPSPPGSDSPSVRLRFCI